ncbi:hypothetical protein NOVO_07720 [Rickettsiales bacterium Ac37b]|nr:hypothetical protein NOVO_07720 [Rickettsiales bacterium Ac37b]
MVATLNQIKRNEEDVIDIKLEVNEDTLYNSKLYKRLEIKLEGIKKEDIDVMSCYYLARAIEEYLNSASNFHT